MKKKKILIVCSSGGHFLQAFKLKPVWEKHNRVWVSFDKADINSLLKNEVKYYAYYPTNRHILNLIKNTFLGLQILFKEKPDVIISTGAGVAIPFCYLGRLMGMKIVYIESFARIRSRSLTGRIIYPIANLFIVQWETMKELYPKAILGGTIY